MWLTDEIKHLIVCQIYDVFDFAFLGNGSQYLYQAHQNKVDP